MCWLQVRAARLAAVAARSAEARAAEAHAAALTAEAERTADLPQRLMTPRR